MKQIMEKIMETSRNLQINILAANIKQKEQNADPIRVGYQGVKGSFSHQALEDYFADIAKVEMDFVHFEDVVTAVKNHEIKYGVLPIENSSTGGITEVYDLVRKYDCHIVGEKIIKVDQNLLGLPGAKIENLKQVYSHPQGLEQSREFFRKHPAIELIPFFNTARSAQMVSESGDPAKGAVARAAIRQKAQWPPVRLLNCTDWKFWRLTSITIQRIAPGSSSSPISRNIGRTRTRLPWSSLRSMNRAPCTKCCSIFIKAA